MQCTVACIHDPSCSARRGVRPGSGLSLNRLRSSVQVAPSGVVPDVDVRIDEFRTRRVQSNRRLVEREDLLKALRVSESRSSGGPATGKNAWIPSRGGCRKVASAADAPEAGHPNRPWTWASRRLSLVSYLDDAGIEHHPYPGTELVDGIPVPGLLAPRD